MHDIYTTIEEYCNKQKKLAGTKGMSEKHTIAGERCATRRSSHRVYRRVRDRVHRGCHLL